MKTFNSDSYFGVTANIMFEDGGQIFIEYARTGVLVSQQKSLAPLPLEDLNAISEFAHP